MHYLKDKHINQWKIYDSKNKPTYGQLTFPGFFVHLIFGFATLGSKSRALDVQGKHSTTELQLEPQINQFL